ncbi:conserved membrane hypothetical protein [Gammaproteobacteria bacterium]
MPPSSGCDATTGMLASDEMNCQPSSNTQEIVVDDGLSIRGGLQILLLLLLLPLIGAVVAGLPLAPYLKFPPTTRPTVHPEFSWIAFLIVAIIPIGTITPFLKQLLRERLTCPASIPSVRDFPWWGSAALVFTGAIWCMAWSSLPLLSEVRRFSFTPLWLGYIAVVNALTWQRSGYSLLSDRPRFLAWLFVLSAAVWWYFEYLNRFVNNWYYQGIENYSPFEYFLTATFPFSTVLPAVLSTYFLLWTYPRLWWGIHATWPLNPARPRLWGGVAFIFGVAGLLGIAIFPQQLYPLVWVAPLILITAAQAVTKRSTVFFSLVRGDWRPVWLAAMAGIICGFFWEMWNWGSYPRWVYSVPGVQRFHLFEMPLLGYTGYLPFGVECLAVSHLYLFRQEPHG